MTQEQLQQTFHDADQIEYTGDGRAYVHYTDAAYALLFVVDPDEKEGGEDGGAKRLPEVHK